MSAADDMLARIMAEMEFGTFAIARAAGFERIVLEHLASFMADAVAAARAEGEAAGAARERADVVEWLMRTEWADEEAYHIEAGRHVGAAGGGAR